MVVLGILTEHKLLFGSIFFLILINVLCILYLVYKERRKDRDEIDDIVSSLAKASPRKKEVVESIKNKEVTPEIMEIEKVLEKMQQDLETDPEDVVASFEQDQEEKAIISYQELVQALKKDDSIQQEVKESFDSSFHRLEDTQEIPIIDIDDDIVVKPIETVPGFTEPLKIEEEKPEAKPHKFQATDFISPIFGKMEDRIEYPKVPQFHKEQDLQDILSSSPRKTRSNRNRLEETVELEPIHQELSKNDEFLQALKDFRNNL